MKKNPTSQSGIFNAGVVISVILCSVGASLGWLSFGSTPPKPTFGRPIISGIGGVGFEQGLRVVSSNGNRLFSCSPGSPSFDTSWIRDALDRSKSCERAVGATD